MPRTRWTLILQASQGNADQAADAVAALCTTYWFPLYAFFRRLSGNRDRAEDLTQGFLVYFLNGNYFRNVDQNRGQFRNYLLVAARNYFINRRPEHDASAKLAPLEIDLEDGERRYILEPSSNLTPEQEFDRQWARRLLEQAMEELRAEYAVRDDSVLFDKLLPYVGRDSSNPPYRQLATELGKSETAVKAASARLRSRLGDRIRAHVALYAEDAAIDDELRHLLRLFAA